jgi:hypothetical protein
MYENLIEQAKADNFKIVKDNRMFLILCFEKEKLQAWIKKHVEPSGLFFVYHTGTISCIVHSIPDIESKHMKTSNLENVFRRQEKTQFEYVCTNCDNSFISNTKKTPIKCKDCGNYDSFSEEEINTDYVEQYCPICNRYFETSDYLSQIFEEDRTKWLANMITHYRHNHISSWNKAWGKNGSSYRENWEGSKEYDELKIEVNERAKRQILRKCKAFMIQNGFNISHVKSLSNTTQATIDFYTKILGKWKQELKQRNQ